MTSVKYLTIFRSEQLSNIHVTGISSKVNDKNNIVSLLFTM